MDQYALWKSLYELWRMEPYRALRRTHKTFGVGRATTRDDAGAGGPRGVAASPQKRHRRRGYDADRPH